MNQTIPCKRCGGTGKLADPREVGMGLRAYREEMGVSLRAVARALGKSATHVSNLERGRQRWTEVVVEAYKAAVNKAAASRGACSRASGQSV